MFGPHRAESESCAAHGVDQGYLVHAIKLLAKMPNMHVTRSVVGPKFVVSDLLEQHAASTIGQPASLGNRLVCRGLKKPVVLSKNC